MKQKYMLFPLIFLSILTSCATNRVTVTRAPEVNLTTISTATVFPFLFNTEGTDEGIPYDDPLDLLFEAYAKYHSTYKWPRNDNRLLSLEFEKQITQTLKEANLNILTPEQIRVLINTTEPLSHDLLTKKTGKITRPTSVPKRPTASVASEPNQPDSELAEHSDLQVEQEPEKQGFFKKLFSKKSKDPNNNQAIDYNFEELWLRGSEFTDIAILGKVTKNQHWVDRTTRDGRDSQSKAIVVDVYTKKYQLDYTLWVFDLATGAILAQKNISVEAIDKQEGSGAFQKLASDSSLHSLAIAKSLPEISKLFNAHTVKETRPFAKDSSKNKRLKEAMTFAKKGEYKAALKISDSVYTETGLYAAGFNAALFAELSNNLEGAIDRMQEVNTTFADPTSAQELLRLRGQVRDRR